MSKIKAVFTLTAAVAFAASPLTTDGFNGFRADQFPVPQVDPPVQPAGYAFAIWGLIYLWLISGAVFGLLKRDRDPGWDSARVPLILSLIIGAAWIPVAQASPFWATVLIWGMLGTGAWALLAAGDGDRIWLRAPIALYTGWLTAASCVALALLLAGYGATSAQVAALGMIGVALVIAIALLIARGDTPEYAFGVIWALIGVIVANAEAANWPVIGLSVVGVATLAAISLRQIGRKS